jgi:hypothetical protein
MRVLKKISTTCACSDSSAINTRATCASSRAQVTCCAKRGFSGFFGFYSGVSRCYDNCSPSATIPSESQTTFYTRAAHGLKRSILQLSNGIRAQQLVQNGGRVAISTMTLNERREG